jgi:hypothetical protein
VCTSVCAYVKCLIYYHSYGTVQQRKTRAADADCYPHYSGKPDPQKSHNSGGLEAQNGAMEVLERSKWRRGGSKLSRRKSVNLIEEQDPDPGPH